MAPSGASAAVPKETTATSRARSTARSWSASPTSRRGTRTSGPPVPVCRICARGLLVDEDAH
eukprot:4458233-Lingulodinium_polyedra.AAC.1